MTTDDVANAPAWERIDPYEEWRRDEEVTKVNDLYVKDLYNLEVGPWPRRGCNGAVLYMDGDDGSDEHLLELPPAREDRPRAPHVQGVDMCPDGARRHERLV